MNKKLVASIILGVLIILTPTIIIGKFFATSSSIGNMYIAEYVMRNISSIIGLLVIYDGVKRYFNG